MPTERKPRLSKAEKDGLLALSMAGDLAARNRLIEELRPLAIFLASKRWPSPPFLADDIRSAAMLALVEVVGRGWNPEVTTFAVSFGWAASKHVHRAINSATLPVELPRDLARYPRSSWGRKSADHDALRVISRGPSNAEYSSSTMDDPTDLAGIDERLSTFLKSLEPIERRLVEAVYGLDGPARDINSAAAEVGLLPRYARRMLDRTMGRLRHLAGEIL